MNYVEWLENFYEILFRKILNFKFFPLFKKFPLLSNGRVLYGMFLISFLKKNIYKIRDKNEDLKIAIII